MNFETLYGVAGRFAAYISLTMVLPLAWAFWFGEWVAAAALGVTMAVGGAMGLWGWLRTRGKALMLGRREAIFFVASSWMLAAILGGLPFLLSGAIPRPEDALFEAMSGFTTTGSTILTDIEAMPKSLLFWRSMTHWLGGMGIIVLFVAVLPALGVGGRLLFQFEVPGVEAEDLKPRIQTTAMTLWYIYLGLSAAELLALLCLGLDLYDSLVHTFGTVATGGFSSYARSVGHFESPAVEWTITVFMFLAGVNFGLYFRWLMRRGGRPNQDRGLRWWLQPDLRSFFRRFLVIRRDPEFRFYFLLMAIPTLIITAILWWGEHAQGFFEALRHAAFQVVAIGTTTGYGTADFDTWPNVCRMFLVLLMFVGGCSGSTGGGMKVLRLMLIVRFCRHELLRFVRPRRVRTLTVGEWRVPDEAIHNTLAFLGIVVLLFAVSSVLLAMMGCSLMTATTSVAATIGNIGPGLGVVGPTGDFSSIPGPGKLLLTFLMLMGRLEVFTALALFLPGLYRR